MKGKKASVQVFEEIKQCLEAERTEAKLEKAVIKISLRDMTQRERMQEASKPLYLKRYE